MNETGDLPVRLRDTVQTLNTQPLRSLEEWQDEAHGAQCIFVD